MTHNGGVVDRYGLGLGTSSSLAAERYCDGMDLLLSFNAGAEESFQRAVEADEGFALAHAALALVLQPQGRSEDATAHVQQGLVLAESGARRERQHIAAVAAIIGGDNSRAMGLIREHLAEFPRDALLLRQWSQLLNDSGRADRHQESFALLDDVASAYGDDWFYLGLRAFNLHERYQFEASRRLAERSLAMYPRNGDAVHSLAHVFYETNDHTAGVEFLEGWVADYDRRAPFHCHFAWHLALSELALGHTSRVLELYEQDIESALVQSRTSLSDASSLLWRHLVYGSAPGSRWQDLYELATTNAARQGRLFVDVHVGLALAGALDLVGLRTLTGRLRHQPGNPAAASVAAPLVEAMGAFAQGEYEETIGLMEPIADQLVGIGGSNAQREVFEDTLIEAYLRSERFSEAESILRRRLARRLSARDSFWLGRAQLGRGETDRAMDSLTEARAGWLDADPASPELRPLGASLLSAQGSR